MRVNVQDHRKWQNESLVLIAMKKVILQIIVKNQKYIVRYVEGMGILKKTVM